MSVKQVVREWIKNNNVANYMGVHPSFAVAFNRFVRKSYPELFKKAQEVVKGVRRYCDRSGYDKCYYIQFPKWSGVTSDYYHIRPTNTLLISDVIVSLANQLED